MQASIVDLRYRMVDVKKALENSEIVTLTDHGRIIADIFPRNSIQTNQTKEHPFFGMLNAQENMSVDTVMEKLRGGRYNAL